MFVHRLPTTMKSLLIETDQVVTGQEKYNLATFMVLFLLITIEVMVMKVVTSDPEYEDSDGESIGLTRSASLFFDQDD